MKAPSAPFIASMTYTKTTDTWPQSCTTPLDAPSGVGCVISAAYCVPTGLALTRKKPSAKADRKRSQAEVAKVRPIRPGIAREKPSSR